MAYNGSGDFNRLYNWQTDRDNGVKIRADRMDAEMDGMATGLSTAICKDGQTTITANLPMSGFKHTGVAAASARNHYADVGSVQDSSFIWCGTAGGTKNALTFSPSPAITAYATGQSFVGIIGATSSDSAATLAISGLATKDIQINGSALSSTVTLVSGKLYRFDYDGTQFQATRLSYDFQGTIAGLAVLASANTFTADQTIQSADAGASAGPNLTLDRNSASPAASDVIGAIPFTGRNSTPATKTYAQVQAEIVDPTAASEDGKIALQTQVAGTLATRGYVAQGLVIGSPTGGDPGAGKINATDFQVNGVSIIGWATSTSAATTSGTTAAFSSLPAGLTEIVLTFEGVQQNTANNVMTMQIGDSGGLEATGYGGALTTLQGATGAFAKAANSTTFQLTDNVGYDASESADGKIILHHLGSNRWAISGNLSIDTSLFVFAPSGTKALSATLDRLTISIPSGAFTAGTIYLNAR